MLYQLHCIDEDGVIVFRLQKRFKNNIMKSSELRKFMTEANISHSLPKGCRWEIHNENSKHFIKE